MPKKQLTTIIKDPKKYFKKIRIKKSFIFGIATVVILLILYIFKSLFVAAIVNGQPISRISIVKNLEKRGGQAALDTLINEALIFQEAKRENVSVTDEEVEEVISKIEAGLENQGGLDQALVLEGMTREELVKQIQMQKLVEKMLTNRIIVTEADVSEYINTNSEILPEGASAEEINETVKNQLQQQKLSSEIQIWLADLRQKAKINYFVEY